MSNETAKPLVIPDKDIFVFNSDFGPIRCTIINGIPYMVGKDVAVCLGYKNTADALNKYVPDDEKLSSQITMTGQRRYMIFITESGLYRLAFSSKMPKAKDFTDWVVKDVLPSIRKTGQYIVSDNKQVAKAAPIMNIANPRAYIHRGIDVFCKNNNCSHTSAWLLFRAIASYKYNINFTAYKHAVEAYFNEPFSVLDLLEKIELLDGSVDIIMNMVMYDNGEELFKMFNVDMNIPDRDKVNTDVNYVSFDNVLNKILHDRYVDEHRDAILDQAIKQTDALSIRPIKDLVPNPFTIAEGF